jgi:hypothetical protein
MPVCNKCQLEKPDNQYSLERNKGRIYRKKYCIDCYRKQSRNWKARKKNKPEESFQSFENNPEYKKCSMCNTWKVALTDYYKHKNKTSNVYNNCKECQKKREAEKRRINREEKFKNNGGSERVPVKPNKYSDDYQRAHTFEFLQILGWTFNEETGIWYKPGVRDITGEFEKMKTLPESKIFMKKDGSNNRKYYSKITLEMYNIMRTMKTQGYTNKEIGLKVNLNDSTVSKWVGQKKK